MIHVRKTIFLCSIALCWVQSAWAQTPPTYTITTVAGDGTPGYAGDGGPANQAQLYLPFAAVFTGGNLYIADQVNNVVRIVTNGNISTLAGNGTAAGISAMAKRRIKPNCSIRPGLRSIRRATSTCPTPVMNWCG